MAIPVSISDGGFTEYSPDFLKEKSYLFKTFYKSL